MPRGPRQVYKNSVLNITCRGNNKKIIFKKRKDYMYFLNLLRRYMAKYGFRLYHYCLMRNHVHLLIEINAEETLAKIMSGLHLAYFHYFKRRYGYVGRFWQGRFYSKVIEDDQYLLTAGIYIERNPVRARLVENPSKYKWSSHNIYAWGKKNNLIDLDPHYLGLAGSDEKRQKIYREMMDGYIKTENDGL